MSRIALALVFGFAILQGNLAKCQIVPKIINGFPTDAYPEVGIVGNLQYGGFCTGTLISPRHVLTAGHCGEEIGDPTTGTFELDGQIYLTSRVWVHPEFDSLTLANDLSILELSEAVPDVVPAELFRDVPLVGELLTLVGFGAVGTPESGGDGSFGVKHEGFALIEEVTPELILWTYDDPAYSNTAFGDSGGPGYLEIDGQLYLASVTSGGSTFDAGLGDEAFNTRVDAYLEWIESIVLDTDEPQSDDDVGQDGGDHQEDPGDEPEDGEMDHRPGHRPWRPVCSWYSWKEPWRWWGIATGHGHAWGVLRKPVQLAGPGSRKNSFRVPLRWH